MVDRRPEDKRGAPEASKGYRIYGTKKYKGKKIPKRKQNVPVDLDDLSVVVELASKNIRPGYLTEDEAAAFERIKERCMIYIRVRG